MMYKPQKALTLYDTVNAVLKERIIWKKLPPSKEAIFRIREFSSEIAGSFNEENLEIIHCTIGSVICINSCRSESKISLCFYKQKIEGHLYVCI